MYLLEASVTGTETALLAAAQAKGITEIRNAACEPHVAELCAFLEAMGARVEGRGMSTIRIEAPAKLRGATYTLRGDYIEAASWAVVGAITGGDVEVTGVHAEDLEPIAAVLAEMHLQFELEDGRFAVGPSTLVGARRVTTGLWPGFPSDIVSLVTVLATQATGQTLVHDWLYELRLFALEQLSAMRADLFLCDPHRIIVSGPTKLRGRLLDSRDIRSGMALIAAALVAEGESTLTEVETVERGYGELVERLRALGADVMRRDD
jgi:UDP-N-acetylglucosamine 1-carboxyvinyltransferase